MVRICLAIVLGVVSGCDTAMDTEVGAVADPEPSPRAAILRNTPTNSDKRCVGITVAVEALLDGIRAEENGPDEVEKIAQQVYDNLAT